MKLLLPLGILLAVVLGCSPPRDGHRSSSSDSPFATNETKSAGPKLKLLSARGTIEYSHITVEGEVENISGEKLDNVQAVVMHYDSQNNLVTSDSALVEYDPLMPGQRTPFRVGTRYNPEMKTYIVDFKFLMGGTISFTDARPAPKSKKKK